MFNLNWFNRKISGAPKTLVLMYHRVADSAADPWGLAVSPLNFEAQISFLKKNYHVISLNEMLENIEGKSIEPNSVCVTFDDGYADNYHVAKPILESHECPATFFIATEFVERSLPYWWDELERIVLYAEQLPRIVSLKINNQDFEFDLGASQILNKNQMRLHRQWRGWEKPISERCLLFTLLYDRLIELPFETLLRALGELKSWAHDGERDETKRPMTLAELKELVRCEQFQIGLHTATHAALPFFSKAVQTAEITAGEEWLESKQLQPMRILAYPYGRFDETTLSIVEQKQLKAAFTTAADPVKHDSFCYRLGRFQVNNWNEKEFRGNLTRWFGRND